MNIEFTEKEKEKNAKLREANSKEIDKITQEAKEEGLTYGKKVAKSYIPHFNRKTKEWTYGE